MENLDELIAKMTELGFQPVTQELALSSPENMELMMAWIEAALSNPNVKNPGAWANSGFRSGKPPVKRDNTRLLVKAMNVQPKPRVEDITHEEFLQLCRAWLAMHVTSYYFDYEGVASEAELEKRYPRPKTLPYAPRTAYLADNVEKDLDDLVTIWKRDLSNEERAAMHEWIRPIAMKDMEGQRIPKGEDGLADWSRDWRMRRIKEGADPRKFHPEATPYELAFWNEMRNPSVKNPAPSEDDWSDVLDSI